MRAVLRSIDLGDDRDWEAVVNSTPDPWQAAQSFVVTVGSDDSKGGELFDVWVATPAGKHLAVDNLGQFRGVLVDHFDAASVRSSLQASIEAIEADSWLGVVKQLCKFMRWEYQGMDPTGVWP